MRDGGGDGGDGVVAVAPRSYAPLDGVQVVGFTGAARHGKDTAAATICALVPGARVYGFSEAISVVARALHGMTRRDPALLQHLGFFYRRQQPTIWLDAIYWRIAEDRPTLAILTGLRFLDEAQMVRELGGEVVRVRRDVAGRPYVATDRDSTHPVEQQEARIVADATWAHEDGRVDRLQQQARAWVMGWEAKRAPTPRRTKESFSWED